MASSDSGVNSSVRNAIENFDENFINESLESLNPFLTKRLFEKTQNVLILDMTPNGESEYKEISLRNLLNKINELSPIDNRGSKRGLVIPVHYRDLRRLDFHLNPVASKFSNKIIFFYCG